MIGSKGLASYGGYESFVQQLLNQHADHEKIQYHVACKENGDGAMEGGGIRFKYRGANCFKIRVPEKLGPAQAIYYDLAALRYGIAYCKRHNLMAPIFYILACRIGPFMKTYVRQIHRLGGQVFINPDGHEWQRGKWPWPVRRYWQASERLMVKHSDQVICDSIEIERYILKTYGKYRPETAFIAYGSQLAASPLDDSDQLFTDWLQEKKLQVKNYHLIVGRFVPENNFETMIREFMASKSRKDLAIITTANERFLAKLEEKLHFKADPRIKFVGTVYNQDLLKKIRENAYAYLHGHSVGGTNPSLLESLSSTKLNLLYDVGFNQEVARQAGLYWTKEAGSLRRLIEKVESFSQQAVEDFGKAAQRRVAQAYSWPAIAGEYEELWLK
ncbi:MAG: DUF1972 domain-containing protein [Lactobacillus equicursoris]|nr:DUF1972 domain-containing protein [Lactobacillus equicursoris]